MSNPQTFTSERVLPELVSWFNTLTQSQRVIKPLDVPLFNVKVVKDPASSTTVIVIGDSSTTIDPTLVVGEATYIWCGQRHATASQVATTSDFFEIAKNITPVQAAAKVQIVASLYDLLNVNQPSADNIYYLRGLKTDLDGGEGYFMWNATRPALDHDGGTILSPHAPLTQDFTNHVTGFLYANLTGQPDGCFIRIRPSKVFLGGWFGVRDSSLPTENMGEQTHAMVTAAGRAGGGDCLVDGGGPMLIDNFVSIESDNVHLKINRELLMGPNGVIRIFGQVDEYRKAAALPALRADSYTDGQGRLVLPVRTGEGSQFTPGDRIVIRGLQAASGVSIEKQTTIVASVVGDNVTCVDEPEFSFKQVYPTSEYPGDQIVGTMISFVRFTYFTSDITTSTSVLPCANVADFSVGDLVKVEDSRIENDFDPIVPYHNACNMEILRIVGVDYGTNTVTLERAVKRPYLTAWQGGISKVLPVSNSTIKAGTVKFSGPQASKGSIFQCIFGNACEMTIGNMLGHDGRRGAAGRIGYSYRCRITNSTAIGAYAYGSGEGYGFTMYYSTYCSIDNTLAASNRHNFLVQTGTDCTIHNCISDDDYISGIDIHGCSSLSTKITNNRVGRSVNFAGTTLGAAIRVGNSSHALGDHNTEVSGNIITGYKTGTGTGAAVDVVPQSNNTVIRDNSFEDCDIGVRLSPNRSDIVPEKTVDVMHVLSNTFTRVASPLSINNAGTGELNQLVFIGNISYQNTTQFEFTGFASLILLDNKITSPVDVSKTGFVITNVPNVVASNNYAKLNVGLSTVGVSAGRVLRNLFGDCTTPVSIDPMDQVIAFHNDNSASTGTSGIDGVNVLGSGTTVSNPTTDLNFTGTGVTVTKTGATTATINIPQAATGITIQDEGATQITGVQSLNFVGANVVAAPGGTNAATVTVLSSSGTGGPGIPFKKTIAIAGDSVTANNYASGTPETMKSNGYWTWADILSNHRLRFPRWNFGVGGDTTANLLARISAVTTVQPDYCIVEIGLNDVLSGIPTDTAIANLGAIYTTLNQAGIFVIGTTLYAPTAAVSFTTAQAAAVNKINNYIRAQVSQRDNFEIVDTQLTFADPTDSMGRVRANYTTDGVHPGTLGAFMLGKSLANLIKTLEPLERSELFQHKSNVWSAENPYGNLVANSEMSGTAGTVSGTNLTGVAPTSWRFDKVSAGVNGGITGVGSVEVHDVVEGMNKFVMTVGSGGSPLTADDGVMFSQTLTYAAGGSWGVGDYIEAIADIEVINPQNIKGVSLDVRLQTASGVTYAIDASPQGSNAAAAQYIIPNGIGYRATYRTAPFLVTAGPTNIRPRVQVTAWSGTTPSVVVKVSRVVFRKVQMV